MTTPAQRSPTTALLLGLIITLAAVVAYSFYIRVQLSGLRKLQSEMVDRNRKDSLQLLRVQNDLNSVGLAMRDMLDASEPYPLTAWTAQFDRIREDLDVALRTEEQLSGANRTRRSTKISQPIRHPILERHRPHVRARRARQTSGSARANPPRRSKPARNR